MKNFRFCAQHYIAVRCCISPSVPMKNQNWCSKHMLNSRQSRDDAETSHSWCWSWNIRHSWEQNTKPFPPLSSIFHPIQWHLILCILIKCRRTWMTKCSGTPWNNRSLLLLWSWSASSLRWSSSTSYWLWCVISLREHKSIMLTCSRPKNLIWFYWMNTELGGYEENFFRKTYLLKTLNAKHILEIYLKL